MTRGLVRVTRSASRVGRRTATAWPADWPAAEREPPRAILQRSDGNLGRNGRGCTLVKPNRRPALSRVHGQRDTRCVGREAASEPGLLGHRRRRRRRLDRERHFPGAGRSGRQRWGLPGPMLLAWVLGGVIAVCGALSFAELAGALPRSGGLLAWLLEAFGPLPAFLFAWAELVVLRGAALGGISTIFADYLAYFVGYGPAQVQHVAAACDHSLVGLLNYAGMRTAASVLTPLTTAKYAAIMLLGLLAFTAPGTSAGTAAVPVRLRALDFSCWLPRSSRSCGPTTAGATRRSWPARCATPAGSFPGRS